MAANLQVPSVSVEKVESVNVESEMINELISGWLVLLGFYSICFIWHSLKTNKSILST